MCETAHTWTVIDGLVCDTTSKRYWNAQGPDPAGRSFHSLRQSDSQFSYRPLLFAKVVLTDEDTTTEEEIKNLGHIRLDVHRVTNVIRSERVPHQLPPLQPHGISEQSKKARMSHQAILGPPVAQAPMNRSTYNLLDREERPHRRFVFTYLSRDLLEIRGLEKVSL